MTNDPAYMRAYYLANKDKIKQQHREYREKNRVGIRSYHRNYQKSHRAKCKRENRPPFKGWTPEYALNQSLMFNYGITIDQYNAMVIDQGNKCAICGSEPPFGKIKRLSVDHCHETGVVRGLLCRPCNSYLGRIKEDPEKIFRYLVKFKDKK